MKKVMLMVSLCALSATSPACGAQSNDELSSQLAQTILLQSEATNAGYRQRIAAASGGTSTQAAILPAAAGSPPAAPVVNTVYWQGGKATVQLTLADGRVIFANPGGVIGGEWRVGLAHGKGVVTRVKKDGAHER